MSPAQAGDFRGNPVSRNKANDLASPDSHESSFQTKAQHNSVGIRAGNRYSTLQFSTTYPLNSFTNAFDLG